jgi:hypothetical protein
MRFFVKTYHDKALRIERIEADGERHHWLLILEAR